MHRAMKTVILRILIVAVFCAGAAPAYAVGWIKPTGWSNGGNWTNGPRAYDGNNATYASNTAPNSVPNWGGWINFTFSSIKCGRILVNCDFGYGYVDEVEVQVYNDDASPPDWESFYTGTVDNGLDTLLTYPSYRNISQMRFRFHYVNRNVIFWLYEVSLYESPATPVVPTVVTQNPTSVDVSTANLHGLIVDDGGDPCDVWFEYRPAMGFSSTTPAQSGYLIDDTFGAFLSSLSGTYYFKACASNTAGSDCGDDLQFTVNSVPVRGWVSPTSSYHDPAPPDPTTNSWTLQEGAYDDEGLTGAVHSRDLGDASPGPWLYLGHPSLEVDKIRFMAKKTDEIASIDIELSDDNFVTSYSVCSNYVFSDSANGTVWNEFTFPAYDVTEARVRFSIAGNSGLNLILYEFDFHTVGVERCQAFVDGAFGGMTSGY